MSNNTVRTEEELLDIFADNAQGRITAQSMRDFVVTSFTNPGPQGNTGAQGATGPQGNIPSFSNVTALKAVASPPTMAQTTGYYTPGDGGGGIFRWDPTDTSSSDNGGTIHAPTSGASGRWKRVYDGWINARWFGVNSSQADNTQALQNAVNWATTVLSSAGWNGCVVFIPGGYYRFKFLDGTSGLSTITIASDNITIMGEGRATCLTTRSSGQQVPYFFTWSQTGVRGNGGGIKDITLSGNSQTQWGVFLDSWRYWEASNFQCNDVYSGLIDVCNNQNTFGENISIRHCDYIMSSATNSCFPQYGVRLRAGSVGGWSECVIRDCLFVGVWDTGVILDGCQRCTVSQVGVGNDGTSSNTIDGSSRTGVLHAVVITNSVTNPSTADTGYHTIENIYMESHVGTETTTNNVAVWIDTPASQTTGFNRFNRVRNVAISTTVGPGIFRVTNTSATTNLTAFNTFEGNRRAINSNLVQVGPNVTDTYIYLTPNSGQLSKVLDQGVRTYINGARNFAYGALYPNSTVGTGAVDVGFITRDTATGRVCWQDRFNVPVLIGPRPGADVVSPYGAQRITTLATPGAPVPVPTITGSTTYTYYVVAIDKNGNKTPPGPAGTITNGPLSPVGSSFITITWSPVDGAVTYDLLRGDTSHSVATGLTTCYYQDQATSTSAYTASVTSPPGTLTVDGHVSLSSATTPTIAAGAGAGTSPTVSVSGNDQSGTISIATGSSPSTSATVATVSFGAAFSSTPNSVILTPANGNAAALNGNSLVYEDKTSRGTSSFVLKVGSSALTSSTTYLFNYMVGY